MSINLTYKKLKDTLGNFIKKAKKVHGCRYSYLDVEYKNNSTNVKIICRTHGTFLMSPSNHLSGQNCPKCSKRGSGWTKTTWKNICKGRIAKLYIIKCWNEDEEFYKIGITSKDSLLGRFSQKRQMPYNYKIVKLVESENDPIYIYNLEKSLHKKHKNYKYKPLIKFAGDTECFSKILKTTTTLTKEIESAKKEKRTSSELR